MLSGSTSQARVARSRARRWLLASAGVACVMAGAIGIVVPGLPTTVFLLLASWCFARSCPWLEERLVRLPIFRPFLAYVESGGGMPRRARVVSTVIMWSAILGSAFLLASVWAVAALVGAGSAGTWTVWRYGRPGTREGDVLPG